MPKKSLHDIAAEIEKRAFADLYSTNPQLKKQTIDNILCQKIYNVAMQSMREAVAQIKSAIPQ